MLCSCCWPIDAAAAADVCWEDYRLWRVSSRSRKIAAHISSKKNRWRTLQHRNLHAIQLQLQITAVFQML